jgi:hypothetical protein
MILIILGLFILYQRAMPQEQDAQQTDAKEVVATGLGSIMGGDVAHARDDAIEDALRTSVENAVGVYLTSETQVENYQLIEDNIYSKTQGYIQKYDVIREEKRNEQLYEVTVKAVVKMTDLKNDLDAIATLIRRKNTPRMMVMIDERNIGEAPGLFHYFDVDMNTAETAIIETFMEKGFRFVDQATVKRNLERAQAAAILEGDAAQAAALGRKVGAEVVLTGKALAKATVVEVYGTKQRSQQATVTARAIRTDTGDIIATGSAQGAFPHIDDAVGSAKAIQKACAQISEDMMNKILDRWQADVTSGTTITLNVRGVKSYSQLNKFKSALKYYVRNLISVEQRDWYEGFATLEVVMPGNSDDLAQRLEGKDVEGIPVKVIGVSQNSVTVEFQDK